MNSTHTAVLPDRSVIRITGPDAEKLLQGVITNDMGLLNKQPAIFAGLLTPQGKILAEFFVARDLDCFLLDVATAQSAELTKRLMLYKLRAKADIRDATAEYSVIAVWGHSPNAETAGGIPFLDPRLPALGLRILAPANAAAGSTAAEYENHRIVLGVPEGGKDYAMGDTFPHEANFDLLNGVSFSKGCFIGQEVVSRMQHRGTARKRIVIVKGSEPLSGGVQITAGNVTIGTIGSVAGTRALGLVRLDRVGEMRAKGQDLAAGGANVSVLLPAYMKQPAGVGTS